MPDSVLFSRVAVAALFCIWTTIRLIARLHEMRTGRPAGDRADRADNHERSVIHIARWVIFALFVPLAVAYPFYPPWYAATELPVTGLLRLLGATLACLGLVFLAWVHIVLGRFWSAGLVLRDTHRLITHGPYRRVRHPMYSAAMLFFFGVGLVSANLLIILPSLAILALLMLRIPHEEAMLLAQFGEEFRAYRRRTGLLLPRW